MRCSRKQDRAVAAGVQLQASLSLSGAILPAPATWNIYVISSAGGSAEHLLPSEKSQMDADWSPDGKSLIFGSAIEPNRGIYFLDLKTRRVSVLPGSAGYFSPHWSPDGRYISGTTVEFQKLMLFDTSTQKWTKPCDCSVGYPMWSHDGKYLYFQNYPAPDSVYRIVRLRVSDQKIEDVAGISKVGRITAGSSGSGLGSPPMTLHCSRATLALRRRLLLWKCNGHNCYRVSLSFSPIPQSRSEPTAPTLKTRMSSLPSLSTSPKAVRGEIFEGPHSNLYRQHPHGTCRLSD
jgi:WD40 repeat protein